MSAIFYACKHCPAIKADGSTTAWITKKLCAVDNENNILPYQILDIREKVFKGMDKNVASQLNLKWLREEN